MTEDQKMSVLQHNLNLAFRGLPDCGREPPGCVPDTREPTPFDDAIADYECFFQDRVEDAAKLTAASAPSANVKLTDVEVTGIEQPDGRVKLCVSSHVELTVDADVIRQMDLDSVACFLGHLWTHVA